MADCQPDADTTPIDNGADTIICSGDDPNGVNGDLPLPLPGGADTILVETDATVQNAIIGDGIASGLGGADTIINNGTTIATGNSTGNNGDIEGDFVVDGDGGNDVITNNGTVAGDMDGDTVDDFNNDGNGGNGGDDILINNGQVGDDMDGDNTAHNGGSDIFINNGIVNGDIEGDDNINAPGSTGGNDRITINGVVNGSVLADAGVEIEGDDVVILQNGAQGGADNNLILDGNGGTDQLVFNFSVPDQMAYDALTAQISGANPVGGSLSFNGQIFSWQNFEQIVNTSWILTVEHNAVIINASELMAIIPASGIGATTAMYCTTTGLAVIGLDDENRSQFLYHVAFTELQAILNQAASTNSSQLIMEQDGQSLLALPSGELQLTDAGGRYDASLWGDLCGT
ncbi:MAG: hypothetical protein R3E39_15225 [Anaerolineae bacterium]